MKRVQQTFSSDASTTGAPKHLVYRVMRPLVQGFRRRNQCLCEAESKGPLCPVDQINKDSPSVQLLFFFSIDSLPHHCLHSFLFHHLIPPDILENTQKDI